MRTTSGVMKTTSGGRRERGTAGRVGMSAWVPQRTHARASCCTARAPEARQRPGRWRRPPRVSVTTRLFFVSSSCSS
jgi:hypothetical protein